MKKVLPKIIQEVGFDFHWSERKVWKLNYPTENEYERTMKADLVHPIGIMENK